MPRNSSRTGSGNKGVPTSIDSAPAAQGLAAGGSLRSKFFASGIILLLTVLTTLMLFLPFMNYELDQQIKRYENFNQENIRDEAETIARLLVFDLSRLGDILWAIYEPADEFSFTNIINPVRTYLWEKVTFNKIIRHIELLDDSGAALLQPFMPDQPAEMPAQSEGQGAGTDIRRYLNITTPEFVAGKEVYYVFMPLYIEGNRWGVVKIAVSTTEILHQLEKQAAEQNRFRWLVGIFFVGTLALSSAVGLLVLNLLASKVTEPLKKLARNAELFAEGGDTSRLEKIETEDDEVGLLAQSFTRMANDINRLLHEKDEAYTKLQASQEQLRQSEKLATLGQLSGGIAHEINNALSPIKLRAEEVLLTLEEGGAAAAEDLGVILKGIEQCTAIVRKLRDFSAPSLGERSLVDVNEVVAESVALIRRQLEKRNIELRLELNSRTKINASATELEQVFMNLLLNARDAIEAKPGAAGGTVTITTREADGAVAVHVRDDGIGMDEETVSKVFDPFFTTKKVGEGTGLGMSVSFGILQSHGAGIRVESEPGAGTEVLVRFPLPPTGPEGAE